MMTSIKIRYAEGGLSGMMMRTPEDDMQAGWDLVSKLEGEGSLTCSPIKERIVRCSSGGSVAVQRMLLMQELIKELE